MRKILLLFASIMMALGMVACGGGQETPSNDNTPEAAVIGYLEAFKAVDQEKLNQYVTEDDLMYDENTSDEDIEQAQVVFKNITYDVKSVNAEEGSNTAIVTTEVSNVDMMAVMQSLMAAAMTESGDVEALEEEEAMKMLEEVMEENKDNRVTETLDIEVTQVDNEWKVKSTTELITVLSGGITPDGLQ